MDSIIQVTNLCKKFHIKQKSEGFFAGLTTLIKPTYREITAVDQVSFSVNQGEVVAFIGPNGAGKSTTIKMLTGILYPTSGSIHILGFNPGIQREKLSFHIGTVFGQKAQLLFHLPPIDTYNLFSRIYELDQTAYKKRLSFLVESFEIGDLLYTPVRKLSLGQRMRCEIAGSLLHSPQILFLDEPTIGLDVIAKQQVRSVIKFLNEHDNITIFLTSHDAGDIETLTKRSIVINHGTIIFDDATQVLKKKYIKTKIVELVVDGSTDDFSFTGGTIVDRGKHSVKVEIDITTTTIERLLSYALEHFKIVDMNIFDPPMEEIITAIYRGG